jgi:HD-like signal output (HDOD) protein
LLALVSQIGYLPTVPSVYTLLMNEFKAKTPSIARIGELIGQDIGMTTKILQVTNSSFFGLPVRITDPTRAVMQLGLERVRALALLAGISCQLVSRNLPDNVLEQLMSHSLSVATTAQNIARAECDDEQLIDDAFTAGMLHDIGILVLMVCLTEEYHRVATVATEQQLPLCRAEQRLLGTTHGDVGAYLLSLWGLPDPIVEAIAWHHTAGERRESAFSVLTAVHAANELMPQHAPLEPANCSPGIDHEYLASLGLRDRVPTWKQLVASGPTGAFQR